MHEHREDVGRKSLVSERSDVGFSLILIFTVTQDSEIDRLSDQLVCIAKHPQLDLGMC